MATFRPPEVTTEMSNLEKLLVTQDGEWKHLNQKTGLGNCRTKKLHIEAFARINLTHMGTSKPNHLTCAHLHIKEGEL